MRDYFWRVELHDKPSEEVDADRYYVHTYNGALEFIDEVNDEEMAVVLYAPGTWRKVLLVRITKNDV